MKTHTTTSSVRDVIEAALTMYLIESTRPICTSTREKIRETRNGVAAEGLNY